MSAQQADGSARATHTTGVLPDTFLVGAPKSGTTYLAAWLGASDAVFVPPVKEPGFFLEPHHYERGLGAYAARYYSTAGREPVVVDATPWYLYPPSVPELIASSIGVDKVKILVVLREPVARAVSMYQDQYGRRRESRSMAQAFADDLAIEDPDRALAATPATELPLHYVLCGRYAEPLGRYLDIFGEKSVCVILAEEMWADPWSVHARLESFLDVALTAPPARAANPASEAQFGLVENLLARIESSRSPLRSAVARFPAMAGRVRLVMDQVARWNQKPTTYATPDPALRQALHDWFAPCNERLAELLDRDLSAWD